MSGERMVTLAQVASQAGVSLATASRVLNGSTRLVGAELRERVLASAEQLHYLPNAPAQAMARGASQFVSLVIGDIADPYFASIASGVAAEAELRGLTVAIAPTGADLTRESAIVSALRSQRPAALLVTPSRPRRAVDARRTFEEMVRIAGMGAGVCYLAGEKSPAPPAPVRLLRLGTRSAAAELGATLAGRGYREFVILVGPADLDIPAERGAGFRAGLRRTGATEPIQLRSPLTRDGAQQALSTYLDGPAVPDCVFAVTDMMAIGAMAALRDHGLRPGPDVAVCGFDDLSLLRDISPRLTTVALPLEDIGRRMLHIALDEDSASAPGSLSPVTGHVRLRASTPR